MQRLHDSVSELGIMYNWYSHSCVLGYRSFCRRKEEEEEEDDDDDDGDDDDDDDDDDDERAPVSLGA